jgi:hypothetical protein
MWIYNLTVTVHLGYQNKEEAGRGSDEVCSGLLHFLETLEKHIYKPATEKLHTLKLFSDGCSSQNKNSTIISALFNFVQKSTILQHCAYVSYTGAMPSDQLLGRIK